MMSLLASVVTGFGMLFSGLFGGHPGPAAMGSTTPDHMNMGSTTMQHMGARMQGETGKITAITGTTFTMTARAPGMRMSSSTTAADVTYTVDASSAKVLKFSATRPSMMGSTTSITANATTMSISDLAVGDSVMVTGPVSGTSITATTVVYGIPGMIAGHGGAMHGMNMGSSSMMMQPGN